MADHDFGPQFAEPFAFHDDTPNYAATTVIIISAEGIHFAVDIALFDTPSLVGNFVQLMDPAPAFRGMRAFKIDVNGDTLQYIFRTIYAVPHPTLSWADALTIMDALTIARAWGMELVAQSANAAVEALFKNTSIDPPNIDLILRIYARSCPLAGDHNLTMLAARASLPFDIDDRDVPEFDNLPETSILRLRQYRTEIAYKIIEGALVHLQLDPQSSIIDAVGELPSWIIGKFEAERAVHLPITFNCRGIAEQF